MSLTQQLITLTAAFHQDAASDQVEALAAKLAASVAAFGCPACVGIVWPEGLQKIFGVACFLRSYGLSLQACYRQDKRAVLLYVQPETKQASLYRGTVARIYGHKFAA